MFHGDSAGGGTAGDGVVRTATGPSSDATLERSGSALVQTHKRAPPRSVAGRPWCIGHVWPAGCGHLQATVSEDAPLSVEHRVAGADTRSAMWITSHPAATRATRA